MMNVTGQQSNQATRVLPCAAAAAFVGEKLYAINVPENFALLTIAFCAIAALPADVADFSPPIEIDQSCHLLAIDLRGSISKLLFKCLFQDRDIAVLTKYERHDQPVIASADLAVGTVIAEKCLAAPTGYIRRSPGERCGFALNNGRQMAHVAGCDQFALADRLNCASYGNAIHNDH